LVYISIAQARGFKNLINIEGGIKAMLEIEGNQFTEYVCPNS